MIPTKFRQHPKMAGGFCAFMAFFLWGIFPVYWKQLQAVPALEILCHRIIWAFLLLMVMLALTGRFKVFSRALLQPQFLTSLFIGTLMIGSNWFLYIWAVNSNQILETSMGYFMNPLFYVLLGMIFFRERLRLFQWVAVSLALIAVIYLTLNYGRFPWVAIFLASTFGFYGLIRKRSPIDSMVRLWLETMVLLPIAGFYWVHLARAGRSSFGGIDIKIDVLLLGGGLVTALPLLFFGPAAKRLPLTVIGFFQYIAPTCQFLLAVFYYGEPFTRTHLITFTLIWVSLVIFSFESVWVALLMKKNRPVAKL